MNHTTQIFKGILEGCILKMIMREETYGYKVVEKMNKLGFGVNEATVYPILTRLQNKGFLKTTKRPSPLGPPRKYYSVSNDGIEELKKFISTWNELGSIIKKVFEEDKND